MLRRCRIAVCLAWGALAVVAAPGQQVPRERVATIEGDNLQVRTPGNVALQTGRGPFDVATGSEISVRSGVARMVLSDGSEVDICGPAQLSLLQSGPALTVALNLGRVHARAPAELPLEVFTPVVKATPLSVGGRARDFTFGFDSAGAVCTLAAHGAVRLEHQLTGASLVVPQGGELVAAGGDLDAPVFSPGACGCQVLLAREKPARAEDAVAAAANQPQLTAVMPALTFDAKSPEPPPRPEVVLLVREVRVQQAVVFAGRVERRAGPVSAGAATPAVASLASGALTVKREGFGTRFRGFFRRLFGGGKKQPVPTVQPGLN